MALVDSASAHADNRRLNNGVIAKVHTTELPKIISGNIRRVDLWSRENSCEPNDLVS
jgi:hypothetical protein